MVETVTPTPTDSALARRSEKPVASIRPDPRRLGADLLAAGLYVVSVAAFFWQLIFLTGVSVPRGGGDMASFLYPAYSFAAGNLQAGVLPLWNPYQFSGSPFAADVQSGLYYPVNLVAFLLARPFTYQTMETLAVFHYFLAELFTYLYGRSLGLPWKGAFAAGIIFAFGGFNVAHLAHLNLLATAAWIPLILLLFHQGVRRGSLRWAAFAGAAFGIAILAGHTQISLYTAFLLGLYWLWALAGAGRKGSTSRLEEVPRRTPGRVLSTLPVSFAVALGLAAVQLVPFAELMRLSLRAELSYNRALEYAASPMGLITLFVPHFFGDNPADFWGLRWSLTEVYGYAGMLTLLLVAVALWVARPRPRWTAFFACAALLALFLSLGEHTALYGWLYRFVPGFDKVRAPGRFLIIFDLALAMLAGYGLAALSRPLPQRWKASFSLLVRAVGITLAGATFVVGPIVYHALLTSQDKDPVIFKRVVTATDSFVWSLGFLALSGGLLLLWRRRWHPALSYLGLGVIVLDLFSANARLNPTTEDVLRGFEHPAIVRYLKALPEPTRIDTATGIADIWQPDSGILFRVPDVLGLFNPLTLADYQHYWDSLGSRSTPAYDLLNAGYLIGRKDVALDRAKFEVAFEGDPELNVYRNRRALPRAFVVGETEVLPREQQLDRLRDLEFQPLQTVVLEPGSAASTKGGGRVLGFRYPTPNEVLMAVDSPNGGYLFTSEVYYPGWRAYVDGQEAPVWRANYVFRAVPLPAGAREVHLVFSPRTAQWGLGVSLATLLGLALSLLTVKFRPPRRAGQPS